MNTRSNRTSIDLPRTIMFALGIWLVLAGFAATARAGQVAVAEHPIGRVYLTSVVGDAGECEGVPIAYIVTVTSKVLFGCWIADGELVLIRFGDGDLRAFLLRTFKPIAQPAPAAPAKPELKL